MISDEKAESRHLYMAGNVRKATEEEKYPFHTVTVIECCCRCPQLYCWHVDKSINLFVLDRSYDIQDSTHPSIQRVVTCTGCLVFYLHG